VRQSCMLGSVRGAARKGRPYRDPGTDARRTAGAVILVAVASLLATNPPAPLAASRGRSTGPHSP